MDIMIFELLSLILIAVVIIYLRSRISLSDITQAFDPEFYIAKPVTINFYSGIREDLTKSLILPAKKAYIDAPAEYNWVQTETPLDDIEEGKLDLAIVRRVGRNAERPNVAFVGNVMDSTLMLMSPNQYDIHDLMDIANFTNVNIIVNNPAARQVVTDILTVYPEIAENVNITENVNARGIYAFVVVHPSPEIAALVRNESMHVVTFNRINKGDYFIKGTTEEDFFNKHRFYEKSTFDMHRNSVKYYPGLSMRGKLLYYPTLKYKYTLFAHKDFSPAAVKRILLDLMGKRIMAETDIAHDPDRLVNTHPGAIEVYLAKQIYTKEPRPPIWQGF
jgi:hypothetical protein